MCWRPCGRRSVREEELEKQVLALFDRIRIQDDRMRDWFCRSLQAYTRRGQLDREQQIAELTRRLTVLRNQQDRLLSLRLLDEIDDDSFASKNVELRGQLAEAKQQLEWIDRGRAEQAEIAMKVSELSQSLRQKWLNADYRAKRQLLGIVCLNFRLNGV